MKKIGDILSKKQIKDEILPNQNWERTNKWQKKMNLRADELLPKIRFWLIAGLVFLMPLWFLPWGLDKIGAAKQLLMASFLGVGFLLWLYEVLSQGKIRYPKSKINFSVWLLMIALLLNTVFSVHPLTSAYASSANFANLMNFLFLGILYLLALTTKKARTIEKLFFASVSLAALYGLFQLFGLSVFGGLTQTIGFNTVGTMTALAALAGIGIVKGAREILAKTAKKQDKWLYLAGSIVLFIFIFLVNVRPVWYGIVFTMAILIIQKIREAKENNPKAFILPLSLIVISLVFLLWQSIIGMRLGVPLPQFNLKGLPTEISPLFRTSLDVAQKSINEKGDLGRMFFGVGLGNFDKMWLKYRPENLNNTEFWNVRLSQGNSSFTTWITETGYLGLAAMLILMALGIIGVMKKRQSRIELAYLSLVWFFYPFNLTLYFAFFLFLALSAQSEEQGESKFSVLNFDQPIHKALIFSLAIILFMVAAVFVVYFSYQRYIASVYTAKAFEGASIETKDKGEEEIRQIVQNELDREIDLLARAYNLDKANDLALRRLAGLYLEKLNLAFQAQEETETLSVFAQNALVVSHEASRVDGTEYENYLALGEVYENLIPLSGNAYEFAVINYDKAAELNPLNPLPIFSKARSRLSEARRMENEISQSEKNEEKQILALTKQGLIDSAKRDLEKALDLKSDYTPAQELLGQIDQIGEEKEEGEVSED